MGTCDRGRVPRRIQPPRRAGHTDCAGGRLWLLHGSFEAADAPPRRVSAACAGLIFDPFVTDFWTRPERAQRGCVLHSYAVLIWRVSRICMRLELEKPHSDGPGRSHYQTVASCSSKTAKSCGLGCRLADTACGAGAPDSFSVRPSGSATLHHRQAWPMAREVNDFSDSAGHDLAPPRLIRAALHQTPCHHTARRPAARGGSVEG